MASKGTGGHDGAGKDKYIIMGAAGVQTIYTVTSKSFEAVRDAMRAVAISRMCQNTAETSSLRRVMMRRQRLPRLQRTLS